MAICVSCGLKTSGSLDWCRVCYKEYIEDIKDKRPWTKALKNEAQRSRRLREKEFDNVSLDNILDRKYIERY